MTANDLIAAFDTVADAPDGVKRLRELVLHLAVRGRLLAQDAREESADALAAELRRQRATSRRVAGKDQGPARQLGFTLPGGWAASTIGDLCSKVGAGSTPLGGANVYVDDGVMFLRSQNVWSDGLRLNEVARILPETHEQMSGTHVKAGDLLFNITGASIGRCARVPEPFEPANVSQHVTIIRPLLPAIQAFLHLVLVSDLVQTRVFAEEVGVSREGLSIAKLRCFPVPLPPLAEQHRIVARVDELMALLDRLEAARTQRDDVRRAARDATLADLRAANDNEAVEAAWRRIAGQMDALFADPDDVESLRQAVLGLAVRGRLVDQDPADGQPSSESLRGQYAAGLPREWRSAALAEVAGKIVDGTHFTPTYVEEGMPFISAKDLVGGVVSFDRCRHIPEAEYTELIKRCRPRRGDVLVTKSGTIGRVAVVDTDRPFTLFESVALIPAHATMDSRFMSFVVRVEVAGEFGKSRTKGAAVQHLHLKELRQLPVPIPPLAEQRRIVACVDTLVALCDDLEARLTTARGLHAQFAAAAVHHLDV